MLRSSYSRNQRHRSSKVKLICQFTLMIAIVWLLYQVRHSHYKRKELVENGVGQLVEESSETNHARKVRAGSTIKEFPDDQVDKEETNEEHTSSFDSLGDGKDGEDVHVDAHVDVGMNEFDTVGSEKLVETDEKVSQEDQISEGETVGGELIENADTDAFDGTQKLHLPAMEVDAVENMDHVEVEKVVDAEVHSEAGNSLGSTSQDAYASREHNSVMEEDGGQSSVHVGEKIVDLVNSTSHDTVASHEHDSAKTDSKLGDSTKIELWEHGEAGQDQNVEHNNHEASLEDSREVWADNTLVSEVSEHSKDELFETEKKSDDPNASSAVESRNLGDSGELQADDTHGSEDSDRPKQEFSETEKKLDDPNASSASESRDLEDSGELRAEDTPASEVSERPKEEFSETEKNLEDPNASSTPESHDLEDSGELQADPVSEATEHPKELSETEKMSEDPNTSSTSDDKYEGPLVDNHDTEHHAENNTEPLDHDNSNMKPDLSQESDNAEPSKEGEGITSQTNNTDHINLKTETTQDASDPSHAEGHESE